MRQWTIEELIVENNKVASALQYTIAERDRLKCALHIATMSALEVDLRHVVDMALSTNSEYLQDVFALLASGGKRNGFFVEFGACDGIAVSNTVGLENRFGWTGILAEPDLRWKLQDSGRTAVIDSRCVSDRTGKQIDFYQSTIPGTSSPDETSPFIGGVTASYKVETISLDDLFEQHNAPRFIDFLSVDTEGHEKEVFINFDFDKYRFGFICVEEHETVLPDRSVQPILEAAGYTVVFPRDGRPLSMQISGIDKFFVHRTHPASKWASDQAS